MSGTERVERRDGNREHGGVDRRRSTRPGRESAQSWMFLLGTSLLIAVHASGVTGQALYPVVTLAATAACVIGIRRSKPLLRWPWMCLLAAGILWTLAGVLRDSTGATGDLSASRSLLPDVFALPGYVLFGVALVAMVRVRGTQKERGIFIDAALVAVGSATMVFVLVVEPTLSLEGAWLPARLAVAVYPALSTWMLIAVVQLTLTRPRHRSGHGLVVAGAAALTIGDIVFALGEVGRVGTPVTVLDVPYLATAAFMGAAALHPGVHRYVKLSSLEAASFKPMRLSVVAMAILAPVVIMASTVELVAGKKVQLVLLAATALLTVWRISHAARSEKSARDALLRRATHDQLTGLPSRELLLEYATSLLDDAEDLPVALMFLDLDEFKLVNDSRGHAAGDMLLMEVGSRLAETVRREDVVGRIGGDEFVVIATGLDIAGAHALGDRIRRAFRTPFRLGTDEVFVTTSIGITIAQPSVSASVMMQEADTAMYKSKERGRNHVTMFDPSMRASVDRRVELEAGLRRSLENNEVSVAFQPIVDTAAQGVVGVEALMRWSTETTAYSPDEFMSIAEDSGLIVPLGEFVLDEACRHVAEWRRTVPGCERMTVSVNLSAKQVQTTNLVDVVADVLDTYSLPGEALWLELTESILLDDTVTTIAVMNGLRMLGVRLAVDDFGTGFSSLSYLRTFPVSRVKIDRSFITDLTTQPASEALVKAVVGIGESMELDVVAEGVETPGQAQRLADLGCSKIQGYLYSRPQPPERVPGVLTAIAHDRAASVAPTPVVRRRSERCVRA